MYLDGFLAKQSFKMKPVILLFLASLALASGQLENKGRRFALACYPSPYFETDRGYCEIDIIAYEPTQVNITSLFRNDTFAMVDGQLHRHVIEASYRTTNGVEPLAFYVESDAEITLQMVNEFPTYSGEPDGMDTSLGLPYLPDALEFILPSFTSQARANGCDSPSPYGFYVVVAYDDDTTLSITEKDGMGNITTFTETLNKFDTLTHTYLWGLPDLTGTRVRSSRPVSVFSGHLCPYFFTGDGHGRGDLAAEIPPLSQIGTEYITPPISSLEVDGEFVRIRVIATENDTTIALQGFEQFENIDESQFVETDVFPNTEARLLTCSKPCLSYTITPEWRRQTGQFMMIHTPNDRFYTDVSFATVRDEPDLAPQFDHQLSIVVQSNDEPQLLLDDEPIFISWNTTIGNYAFGSVSISTGQHRLVSTNQEKFAAYVHGHCRYFPSSGYGNPAGMGVLSI